MEKHLSDSKSRGGSTLNNIEKMFSADPAVFAESYLEYLIKILKGIDTREIGRFVTTLLDARDRGATVFFIGNGGSASTASHFANDLAIGTRSYDRPFRVVSLTDNNAVITAIGNDHGYEEVFSRQLQVLGKEGDVIVAISASGNSANLIRAFDVARTLGITTVAITAFDGGLMKQIADHGVHVPTEAREYGPAEDAHMVLDHLVGAYLTNFVKLGTVVPS